MPYNHGPIRSQVAEQLAVGQAPVEVEVKSKLPWHNSLVDTLIALISATVNTAC